MQALTVLVRRLSTSTIFTSFSPSITYIQFAFFVAHFLLVKINKLLTIIIFCLVEKGGINGERERIRHRVEERLRRLYGNRIFLFSRIDNHIQDLMEIFTNGWHHLQSQRSISFSIDGCRPHATWARFWMLQWYEQWMHFIFPLGQERELMNALGSLNCRASPVSARMISSVPVLALIWYASNHQPAEQEKYQLYPKMWSDSSENTSFV